MIQYSMKYYSIRYLLTNDCLTIYNSYQITSTSDMEKFLVGLRYNSGASSECIIFKRSLYSMIDEWKAHNLLYKFGLFRSHTKDVDIDNESKCRKFFYKILSKIYNLIY